MKKNLFYIGSEFYEKSGSMMSSIYEVGTLKRYDWGFVQRDLAAGIEVNIRPANSKELMWAYSKLGDIVE